MHSQELCLLQFCLCVCALCDPITEHVGPLQLGCRWHWKPKPPRWQPAIRAGANCSTLASGWRRAKLVPQSLILKLLQGVFFIDLGSIGVHAVTRSKLVLRCFSAAPRRVLVQQTRAEGVCALHREEAWVQRSARNVDC